MSKTIFIREINGKFEYPIVIGEKIILQKIKFVEKEIKNKKVIIIYDDYFNLKKNSVLYDLNHYMLKIANDVKLISIKSRDKNKNLKTLSFLINKILKFNIEKFNCYYFRRRCNRRYRWFRVLYNIKRIKLYSNSYNFISTSR